MVPFEAYHELSILSDLPSSSQVRTLAASLNSQFKIKNLPKQHHWGPAEYKRKNRTPHKIPRATEHPSRKANSINYQDKINWR